MTKTTNELLAYFTDKVGERVTTADLKDHAEFVGLSVPTLTKRLSLYKAGRGVYNLVVPNTTPGTTETTECVLSCTETSLVPEVDPLFVPFGFYNDLTRVLKSRQFYPVYVVGETGTGKTHAVLQACAKTGREVIRVNFSAETDEDSLIGGFRLVDGNTKFHEGPVVDALRRGAVLLLDEVDLASNRVLCLQSVLEGNGVYLKKTNTYVRPTEGFTIIATGNSKGKGSSSGRYLGVQVQNEAFLERFAVTFEQEYPTPTTEIKILTRVFAQLGNSIGDDTIKNLVDWADIIRKTYNDGGIEDVISTRRLINIAKAISIWGSVDKAIELSTNRFDDDTATTFRELFSKVSGPETPEVTNQDLSAPSVEF